MMIAVTLSWQLCSLNFNLFKLYLTIKDSKLTMPHQIIYIYSDLSNFSILYFEYCFSSICLVKVLPSIQGLGIHTSHPLEYLKVLITIRDSMDMACMSHLITSTCQSYMFSCSSVFLVWFVESSFMFSASLIPPLLLVVSFTGWSSESLKELMSLNKLLFS